MGRRACVDCSKKADIEESGGDKGREKERVREANTSEILVERYRKGKKRER